MKIIIAGAGEVGYHLAKQLSMENHDITIIDVDSRQLERADSNTEVLTLLGSSTSLEILNKADVSTTDLLVAVTSSESVNINTVILAKKLGAKKTIARVGHAEYVAENNSALFHSLGIDHLIYPEELASNEIAKLIERAAATDILEFEKGKLSLLGLRLDPKSIVLGKSLKEVASEYPDVEFRLVAIQRGMRTIIPGGEDLFLRNDQIFVLTTHSGIEEITKIAGKAGQRMENIMILGGGKIGRLTAKMLENSINIKIIESDREKSRDIADILQKALIIQGDGRDLDLLAQEGIVDMDAFIAVTEDAETNIITCLMAKHLGVGKTIALIDNVDYIPLTQTIGLDSLINKKLIAANSISKFIRRANIVSIASIQGVDAEILEYVAQPGSAITKKEVKDLKFPHNAILGGYIRGGEGFITVGNTRIQDGDKVVVVAMPEIIDKVEKLFN